MQYIPVHPVVPVCQSVQVRRFYLEFPEQIKMKLTFSRAFRQTRLARQFIRDSVRLKIAGY